MWIGQQIPHVPCHIICLAANRSAREHTTVKNMRELFRHVTVFDAIEAQEGMLSRKDIVAYPTVTYDVRTQVDLHDSHLGSLGALGCFLSHYQLWREAAESEFGFIIAEEDCPLQGSSGARARDSLKSLHSHVGFASIVNLPFATSRGGPVVGKDACWSELDSRKFMGTQCYWISPTGALILADNALPIFTQVDYYVKNACGAGLLAGVVYREAMYPLHAFLWDGWNSSVPHANAIYKFVKPPRLYFVFLLIFALGCISALLLANAVRRPVSSTIAERAYSIPVVNGWLN
jgi:GR25 family glycosyltransferase involved in LPS biosynthesis